MIKLLSLLSIICVGSLFFFEPQFKKKSNKVFYFAPPEIIKYFSFGFEELYADILWMRLLQNVDFCSSKKGLPIYDGETKYECEKGWSYKMTSAITELAPRFLAPYEISGSILSVIMGDKLGAKKIYDKALKVFPNNWQLHFSASYHYLVELKEEEKAAKLLIKTADLGGPLWLYALAAKTYKKKGRLLLAKEILNQAIKKDSTKKYKKAFEIKLKEVERELSQL
ncbi:MAG: hypothetical protein OXC37_05525 [Bdellovibrionaceae bacterium]|nr:hypothetical protein [Pseudobdellovibrionaceae bacterium]